MSGAPTEQTDPARFFTLAKRSERRWLLAPDGRPSFSRGPDKIDSRVYSAKINVRGAGQAFDGNLDEDDLVGASGSRRDSGFDT